jgi:AraC-like DNA-binding protein
MLAESFVTHALPKSQQLGAWRAWYDTIFDVTPALTAEEGFTATNSTWTIPGMTLSSVASPANTVNRTKSVIRHNAVDHWVITLSKRSVSDVETRGQSLEAAPGTPFIISLADEVAIRRREQDERMQILLARDSFETIAPLLDTARGLALTSPAARMLADYLLLLEKNLPDLPPEDAARLKNAVQAMLAACLAPTPDGVAIAKDQIHLTLMERVRQAVRRNLRSPSLGPDRLCREAATSRSQLYRLLESEGGVASYIQRRRLSEAFSMLCDVANSRSIGKVAELLCFADASTFSRAFRREFGMSPSDVRAISSSGMPPAPTPKRPAGSDIPRTFSDCLRGL